jgi:RHS repeat-associated protein
MNDFGLLDYVARMYDPILGRFVQADSIVPGAGNPMAYDRFAYALNNPLRYTDPSGHLMCDSGNSHIAEGDCSNGDYNPVELAIKITCTQMDCYGDNITWIDVDFSVVADLLGYNPGVVSVPVHTDVNYSVYNAEKDKWERYVSQQYLDNPDLLFPWEGPALVLYSEDRQFHPDGTEVVYPDVWIQAAIGILNTMWVRMTNDEEWSWPDYQTLNQAAFSSYALPQIPESRYGGVYEPRFNEFLAVTLSWYALNLNISENWSYDFFNHRPDGATCFGPTAGVKELCIPSTR